MNILERAKECQSKIQQLQNLNQNQNYLQNLEDRKNNFGKRRKMLEQEVQKVVALQNCGFAAEISAATVQSLQMTLASLAEKAKENPGYIVDTFRAKEASSFFDALDNLSESFRTQTSNYWQRYVQSSIPDTDDELLSSLARIPEFRATVNDLKKSADFIRHNKNYIPTNSQQVASLKQAAQKLDTLWKQLHTTNVPQDVLVFLKESSSATGASLELLTPVTHKWLMEHGLISKFRIWSKGS